MKQKINKFTKIFPWYTGLEGDLLFYIAIDTLFLTVVKNFSPAQIVSLDSFSEFICIALQFPVLFVIKRIGNTASVRTGAFCLLLSSLLITFGNSFYLVLIGRIFHDIAAVFRTASFVMLENNLDLVNRRQEFVRVRTAANTVYSLITMLISFVASLMFNYNYYLPMIGCITTCTIGYILTFFIKDYSDYNKISYKTKKVEKVKIHYSKFIIMAIVFYAIFYLVVKSGQKEGKLFIQQHILLDFNVDDTAFILGAIICISRIIRVFSNVLFAKLYVKYQKKMGIALSVLLGSSIAFMLFGSLIPLIFVKIFVMAIGYMIILFVRDPFKLYLQDVVFEVTPKEQHQTLLTMLEFGVKIGTVGMGLIFASILTEYPMIIVMSLIFIISLIEILLSIKLYKMTIQERQNSTAE